MHAAPLMTFKSHVDGKNADVEIYSDRIEWAKAGAVSLTRIAAGVTTAGLSLAKTGLRKGGDSEMIPVKAMSSVTTGKDGLRFYKVVVICSGNTVEFRVDKADGEAAKTLLTQLILGTHPSQQASVVAQPPPSPPPPPPAPPAPAPTVAAPPPGGLIEQLKELAALRDQGILTDAEFDAQKARLLAPPPPAP